MWEERGKLSKAQAIPRRKCSVFVAEIGLLTNIYSETAEHLGNFELISIPIFFVFNLLPENTQYQHWPKTV